MSAPDREWLGMVLGHRGVVLSCALVSRISRKIGGVEGGFTLGAGVSSVVELANANAASA